MGDLELGFILLHLIHIQPVPCPCQHGINVIILNTPDCKKLDIGQEQETRIQPFEFGDACFIDSVFFPDQAIG